MRNGTKDSDKAHRLVSSRFCAAVECLVGEPKGPVVPLPRNRPRHAVHLAAGPSVGDVQSLLGLVLGCHAEVSTSQVSSVSR